MGNNFDMESNGHKNMPPFSLRGYIERKKILPENSFLFEMPPDLNGFNIMEATACLQKLSPFAKWQYNLSDVTIHLEYYVAVYC